MIAEFFNFYLRQNPCFFLASHRFFFLSDEFTHKTRHITGFGEATAPSSLFWISTLARGAIPASQQLSKEATSRYSSVASTPKDGLISKLAWSHLTKTESARGSSMYVERGRRSCNYVQYRPPYACLGGAQ